MNAKICAISKDNRKDMLVQDHRSINSGRHPKVFFRDRWRIIANGQVWHGEIKNRVKDGPCSWVATTIVLFLDHDGKPRPFVAISTDFTKEKRNEAELVEKLRSRQLLARQSTSTNSVSVSSRASSALSMRTTTGS